MSGLRLFPLCGVLLCAAAGQTPADAPLTLTLDDDSTVTHIEDYDASFLEELLP